MKGADEPENPLHGGDEELDGMIDVAVDDPAVMAETKAVLRKAPLPWIGAMPRSIYGLMAVVNEDGYLVPVWTAGDLLRACKIIWQATKD